jgi:hypothetical protein
MRISQRKGTTVKRVLELRWLTFVLAVFLATLAMNVPRTQGQSIWGDSTATVYAPAPSAENFAVPKNTTVSLGVSATANPNPPTPYDPEASLGDVTWTFTWVSAKVLATDPGGSYDWSSVSPADSSAYEKTLTTFNFTPKEQGYWHVTVRAYATWTEYKDGVPNGATHHTFDTNSPATGVTMIAVTPTVLVWNDGVEDWDDEAEIAAGAIPSWAHQTTVFISSDPPVPGVRIPITLVGGYGHTLEKDAALYLDCIYDSATESAEPGWLAPGDTAMVLLDEYGETWGILSSSDIFTKDAEGNPSTGVTIFSYDDALASVLFGWDNYEGDDQWYIDSPYIEPNGDSDVWLWLGHDYEPIDGHTIRFFVEEVRYLDENSQEQVLYNTLEDPSDLSDWAEFVTDTADTNEFGWVHVVVHWGNCPNATWIGFKAYDQILWPE